MRKLALGLIGGLALAGAAAALAQEAQSPPDQDRAGPRSGMGRDRMGRDGMGGPMMRRGDRRGVGAEGRQGRAAMTDEEIDARLRERFARLDRNSDGVIDAQELEAAFTSRSGRGAGRHGHAEGARGAGPMMGRRFIARYDQNGDGKVTRDEFLTVVRERFQRADLDNDGKITDADLPPMLRGQGVLTSPPSGLGMPTMMRRGGRRQGGMGMLAWLRNADTNHDGQITAAEVEAAALKRFDALDRNHDGVVDQTDFDALAKDTVAYRVQRFLHTYGADRDGRVTRDQFMKVGKQRWAEHRRMAPDKGAQGMHGQP